MSLHQEGQAEQDRPSLPEGMDIEPMTTEDAEVVATLDRVCFPSSWTKESYLRELSNPHCCYLVVRRGGEIIAYGGVQIVGEEAHLSTLCVAPEHRRSGLARALLSHLLGIARKRGATQATLEVREHNDAAQALYRSFGFRIITLQRGYYGDSGENALVMGADL